MLSTLVIRIVTVIAVLSVVVVGVWTFNQPAYIAKWRIQEAYNVSAPARTAVGVACLDGRFRVGLHNEHPSIGLQAPGGYEIGPVRSVTVTTPDDNTATITVLFKAVTGPFIYGIGTRTFVEDGATLIWRSVCAGDKYALFIDPASTLAKKLWPKPYKVYPATAASATDAVIDEPPMRTAAGEAGVAKSLSARDLADLRARPGRPECYVGEPGVAQYTAHDPRFVVKDPVTGLKTVTNRIMISFVDEARNEDIVDSICRVNGTIVTYLSTLRFYAIQIPDSVDLQLLRSTITQLRADRRVRWAYDVNVGIYQPAGGNPAQ